MGCAPSHEVFFPATTTRYDWDAQEGGYIPYRFQNAHRERWRHEDRRAYEKQVGFEKERSARRYADVEEKKRAFRRAYDERNGRL